MKFCQSLVKAIRSVAVFNPEAQVEPACILWPDKDCQWEAAIPRLRLELPELLVLGDYDPDKRTGPAIWLRCVIAGKVAEVPRVTDRPPILYLPGVGRSDLRAVESCPEPLKPLAELQYRGVIWSQVNAKDWTILAFLKSEQGGMGLDVALDAATRSAMQLASPRLLDEDVETLAGKHLDKDFFNTLLTGGDPVRDLLRFLDLGQAFQASRSPEEWTAFNEVCKSQFNFHPEVDGVLAGAACLAKHAGPWRPVWERYGESPAKYANIPVRIRQCPMPVSDLLSDAVTHGGWPQWNEQQEEDLRRDLLALASVPVHVARQQVLELEKKHADRRRLPWAELGLSPLARALEHLALLADVTGHGLVAGSAEDLAVAYQGWGWKADDALLRALAEVEEAGGVRAVETVIRSIYLPWAEASSRHLQTVVETSGYPGGTVNEMKPGVYGEKTCLLFVDGLRFDLARRLAGLLTASGYAVDESLCWSALPTVTSTGKAAVTPVREMLAGSEENLDFEPYVVKTGQSLKGGAVLRKLLSENGWEILDAGTVGEGTGRAWCEYGDTDQEGHNRGVKLARQVDSLIKDIRDRVVQLLSAGWGEIKVVTDHGWLLMPGGLPKVELSSVLTESKWGRCALIKPGASTETRQYPWYWNPFQYVVLADGVGCFRKGMEYAHGGLSLQECLTLALRVTLGKPVKQKPFVQITDLAWKGLRCSVAVEGVAEGLSLDLRSKAGDAGSSVAMSVRPLKPDGTGSVVVEDEDLTGEEVTVVLLDGDGEPVAQLNTTIGGRP